MKLAKTSLIAFCILCAGIGTRVDAQSVAVGSGARASFTVVTQQEIALILGEAGESNPSILKRFEEDPDLRRAQLASIRQLLALATEAQRSAIADKRQQEIELDNIRMEVIAVNYDKHVNKGKADKPPFGYITDAAVKRYWGEDPVTTVPAALKAGRKARFDEFLGAKIYFLRRGNPEMEDKVVSAEETAQARELFAKIRIYSDEYAKRSALLPLAVRQRTALQVKLQQAQFLARLYSEELADQSAASEEEIAAYVKKHPELDSASKRAKAEGILARAKAGEDFAKLANEFTEDPGNKNSQDEPQGGLYANVGKGVMVPPFERAALALEPGQVASQLVESDFGFHVMKLERKNVGADETYDVRHILIGTTVSDPSNPGGRPVPAKEYARGEIEREKEKVLIDQLVAKHKISVPEDFVVPAAVAKPEPKAKPAAKRRPARKRT
jgi:parvulin-like peptidyl-prolyl isomerase